MNQSKLKKEQHLVAPPKRSLLHLVTRIQVSFCAPDEYGNAGQPTTLNLELQKLDRQIWAESFETIQQEKAKLKAQIQAVALPPPPIEKKEKALTSAAHEELL